MESITNKQFLQAIFGTATVGVVASQKVISASDPWILRQPDDFNIKRLIEGGKPANCFYCISSITPREGKLYRKVSDLEALYVVPLDDIGTKDTDDNVPLDPSYIIETSPGNFQYGYILDKPLDDIPAARALLKLITQDTGDGAAPIPNKMVRLPVGFNNKEKYGTPAPHTKLTHWEPELRYSVEDLLDAWEIDDETFEAQAAKFDRPPSKPTHVGSINDEVMLWLDKKGMVRGEEKEGGWFDIQCPWHYEHTEGGADEAVYSPLGYGGEYAGMRQFNCLHEHCKDRTSTDVLHWMFHDRYVFNTRDNTVKDCLRPELAWSVAKFNEVALPFRYKDHNDKMRQCSDYWMRRTDRVEVQGERFFPTANATRAGVYRDPMTGELVFNTFVPFTHPETEDTDLIQPILNHLEFEFGSEYENALGFFGYSLHRPEIRLKFALLHVASYHGTGRGFIKELLDKLFKLGYHKPASFQNYLKGNYNEFLHRSLVVSFDEVFDRKNRFSVGDQLRELITEKYIEVNVKFGYKGPSQVFANMMFLSNHENALSIPDSDRRFWCVQCPYKPKPKDYYKELYSVLEDEEALAQFFWFLKRWIDSEDCKFEPQGTAPQTEWTQAMQRANEDDTMEAPIRETVEKYRVMELKAVWRSQIINDCRAAGADVSLSTVGASAHNMRYFSAVLAEQHVSRYSARIRRSNGRLEYLYRLDKTSGVSVAELREQADDALQYAAPSPVTKL